MTDMVDMIWESMQDDVVGEINIDASSVAKGAGEDHIEVHCYDGRRYDLTLTRLPNGCKYDLITGEPIVEDGKPQLRTRRDALLASIEAMSFFLNEMSTEDLDIPLSDEELNDFTELVEYVPNEKW